MFSMICQSCRKQNEPYLDKDTDVVHCSECDKEMNVNHFTKTQMRSMKQYRVSMPGASNITCQSCKKNAKPLITNKDLVCPACKKSHSHLTSYFKQIIIEQMKKGSDIGG